ncbi:hypothetical protein DL546_009090 [Coniochaeta pulveracea]|uniref:peptidyl-tRNA hydrolase n=1 Tax=Coniochaeta pulveracea TaxID=177199 RepID=A0A420YK21_9PEZI|nr:hypothetical protein DL546_009090 [Coniochaeta pulveracea]
MFNPRFLVVSLGNPAPYHETIHSAGHVALIAAQHKLRATQPDFTALRFGKKSTQTSLGPKYTFIQSPTEMNITGPWLSKAYRDVLVNENLSPSEMGLILVHDDLESDFGKVKVRKWDQSHKGHNGIKSVAASLRSPSNPGCAPWSRISIGVGRPTKRDAATVSEFVLRPLSKYQKELIADNATPDIMTCLSELEEEWRERIG